jgi:hypothetical protein
LVLYFSELPIISYDFSKIKTIYKSFLKLILKKERIFIKNVTDISMTSAIPRFVGRYWAESVTGAKVAQWMRPG